MLVNHSPRDFRDITHPQLISGQPLRHNLRTSRPKLAKSPFPAHSQSPPPLPLLLDMCTFRVVHDMHCSRILVGRYQPRSDFFLLALETGNVLSEVREERRGRESVQVCAGFLVVGFQGCQMLFESSDLFVEGG